jgi:hypothetical protein
MLDLGCKDTQKITLFNGNIFGFLKFRLHLQRNARKTGNGKRRTEASGGRNMNNPVQVARSDTQLGDGECAKENPRGEQAVKKCDEDVPRGMHGQR